ncbi:hypothetical protein [Methylocystis echinoides]|jgi:hypothetical protein|uniref:hypothetical protein n=1 Tax=Methylocystis echinoides TaxID=29468 RepID=UPI00342501A7
MADTSKAWVWSQYRAVAGEDKATANPLPLFGNSSTEGAGLSGRTRRGAALALAMIIGLFFPKIAFLLLVLAVLLILSGLEPTRFQAFMETVPGGSVLLKVLGMLDALLG